MKKTKIIIADDHPLFRFGLVNLINQNPDVEIIAEAGDGEEVIKYISNEIPDIVILDIEMPILNGLQVCEWIKKNNIETKIIILTLFKEKELYKRALKLGVKGYLLKDYAIAELTSAIEIILSGGTYLSQKLQDLLIDSSHQTISENAMGGEIDKLSNTERKILLLISENKTTKEIAKKLFSTEKTIENHRYNICKKLKLESGQNNLLKFAINNHQFLK